jgi:ABC-type multidrug transport system ATPase subunit
MSAQEPPFIADDAFLSVVLTVGGTALALAAAPPLVAVLVARRARAAHAASPPPVDARAPVPCFVEFSFRGVRAELPARRGAPGRAILQGAWGSVCLGELCALVGPSGGGKSTLLNALAGEPPGGLRLSGAVVLDGHALDAPARRAALGFVPQGDTHCNTLTARETVLFSAALRGAGPAAGAGGDADAALAELGLQHAAHTRVASLSGGERRRVTIAAELVLAPPLLLLDEPTSGLDAASALALLRTLAALAAPGRGVLAAVHAPSGEAFALFRRATLLARGCVLWAGAPGEAPAFFAAAGVPCPPQRTAAEHLLFVAAAADDGTLLLASAPAEDSEAATSSDAAPEPASPALPAPAPRAGAPLMRQLRLLLWRELLQAGRAPALLISHLLLSLGVAVWLGVVYNGMDLSIRGFQNRLGVAFFVGAFFGLSALSACDALCGSSRVLLRAQARRFYHVSVPALWISQRACVLTRARYPICLRSPPPLWRQRRR